MILSGNEIKKQIKKGNIIIDPFDEKNINPNSYNYRLGNQILLVEDDIIDPKKKCKYRTINLDETGYCLEPNRLYLGSTVERIGSDKFVTLLIGRSSVGRIGLFLQVTASLGHVGAIHSWTLELKCVQPIVVYARMKIGQVSFWEIEGDISRKYSGKYGNYNLPHISSFYNELNIL